MSILDWFRRKKKKTQGPLQVGMQSPVETKGEVRPKIKVAEVRKKTRRKSAKRRRKSWA